MIGSSPPQLPLDAQKNGWGTWLLLAMYKKVEECEEEKARKDRERQERRIEKDLNERRLVSKKADLMRGKSVDKSGGDRCHGSGR